MNKKIWLAVLTGTILIFSTVVTSPSNGVTPVNNVVFYVQ